MKISVRLLLYSTAIFALCGALLGMLESAMRIESALSSANMAARAAAICAADLSAESEGFLPKEKLDMIAKQAGMSSISVASGVGTVTKPLGKPDKFEVIAIHTAKNAEGKSFTAKASVRAVRAEEYRQVMPHRVAFWIFLGAFFGVVFGFIAAKGLAGEIEKLKKSLSEGKGEMPPEFKISEISDLSNSSMLISEIGRNRLASESEELGRSASARELGISLSSKVFPDFELTAFGMSIEVAYGRPNLGASFAAYIPSGKIVFGNLDMTKADPLEKLAKALVASDDSVAVLSKYPAAEAFGKISAAFKFSSWKVVDFAGDVVSESGFESGRFYERSYPKEKPLLFSSIESGKTLRLYALLRLPKNETMKILSRLSPSNEGGVFIRLEKIK